MLNSKYAYVFSINNLLKLNPKFSWMFYTFMASFSNITHFTSKVFDINCSILILALLLFTYILKRKDKIFVNSCNFFFKWYFHYDHLSWKVQSFINCFYDKIIIFKLKKNKL